MLSTVLLWLYLWICCLNVDVLSMWICIMESTLCLTAPGEEVRSQVQQLIFCSSFTALHDHDHGGDIFRDRAYWTY